MNKLEYTKGDLIELQELCDKYKTIIDKAIKYIEKETRYSCISGVVEFYGDTDKLLKILKGGEIDE